MSTKISEEEFIALESGARARKLTLSEWVRRSCWSRAAARAEPGREVLLGEVLALRTILMNLLLSISNILS